MVPLWVYVWRYYLHMYIMIIDYHNNSQPVCTKGSRFPYILLTAQEVRVYFVAMITLRHAPACERSTYTRLIYQVCDYITLSIYSTIARLYGAPLIFAYGAGPPKVSGPSEGHGGEQHITSPVAIYFSVVIR